MDERLRRTPDAPRGEALEALLEALDRGGEPDWAALASKAGSIGDFGGLERALERYRSLMREVRIARGEPSLRPGDHLGDFEVEGLLGRGGMGEVHRARQLSLGGREVALKVLHPRRRSDLDRERFEREARVLSRLHHPHLAEVYGFGSALGQSFLAMRLVAGPTLAERLERGPRVASATAVRWIEELASALAVVHRAGLVHRDVKPANVVLEPHEEGTRAVLIDFGLVREVESGSHTGSAAAPFTRAYAAPEQLLGRDVDARADVYALGIVLREVLDGADCDPDHSRAAQRDLRAVVLRATHHDARRRYADAAALRDDLAAWRAGERVSARVPRWDERCRTIARRHGPRLARWAGVVGAAVALGLAARSAERLASNLRALHAADRRGDLLGLRTAALALPPPALRWLVHDLRLRGVSTRLARADQSDPLTEIAGALHRGEGERALRAAGTVLEQHGLAADQALLRILVDALGDASARATALDVLMLAADRNPVCDAAAHAATEPLRLRLRDLVADPGLAPSERLRLIALDSSVGDIRDAQWLVGALPGLDPASEEARLSNEALERMLRRAWRQGRQAAWLDGVEWSSVEAHVLALRRSGTERDWANVMATTRLVSQLHLARRRVGRPSSPWKALPAEWVEPRLMWLGEGCHETVLELAACGDRAALACVGEFEPMQRRQWQAAVGGRIGAWVGDCSWTEGLVPRLCALGWAASEAREEVQRVWLEARSELEQAWSAAEASQDGALELDGIYLDDGGHIRALREELAGGLAQLTLTHASGPHVSGACRAARTSCCGYRREGSDRPYLRLERPGESALHVEFDVGALEGPDPRLEVLGQLSTRRFLPLQGTAKVGLELDGAWVATRVMTECALGWRSFPLDGLRPKPGVHTLSIRLEAGSTTDFRIECVRLVP